MADAKGPEELDECLRAYTALKKDPVSVPSIQVWWLTDVSDSRSRSSDTSGLHGYLYSSAQPTLTKTHVHIKQQKQTETE